MLQPVSARGHFTWNLLLGAALWAIVAALALVRRGELTQLGGNDLARTSAVSSGAVG